MSFVILNDLVEDLLSESGFTKNLAEGHSDGINF
jgi:hypothetical protein